MDALTVLAPWWLLALVHLALGGLCVVLALYPLHPSCPRPPHDVVQEADQP